MKGKIKKLIDLNCQADELRTDIFWQLRELSGKDRDIEWNEDCETLDVSLTLKDGVNCTVQFSLKRRIVKYSHEMSNQEKNQFYKVFDEVMAL